LDFGVSISVSYFQAVIFNDRVAQQFVRGVIQSFARRRLVGAGDEVNLDVFADVDAGDAGVAHVFEGGLDGFALRIQDGFLRSDDDFGFHVKPAFGREKRSDMLSKQGG
jgi:hypothetical protein